VASARGAVRARRHAAEVAQRSVGDVVGAALEEERVRMSADIEAVVRAALTRMDILVARLRPVPDAAAGGEPGSGTGIAGPAVLREIQREGRSAAAELRRLIGL